MSHVTADYRLAFDKGRDLLHWAEVMERVSCAILEHLDVLVDSTFEP